VDALTQPIDLLLCLAQQPRGVRWRGTFPAQSLAMVPLAFCIGHRPFAERWTWHGRLPVL